MLSGRSNSNLRTNWNDGIKIANFRVELALLLTGIVLFGVSFPGIVFERGLFVAGYVALVPVFLLVRYASWPAVAFYGFFYGFGSYALFNYWLQAFHPLAIYIVPLIYALYFSLLFPLLKLAVGVAPRWGYLLQGALWIGYELLRTKGYLGYSYGIMGYSQYGVPLIIQIASLFGVWGVSLLVVLSSALLADIGKGGMRTIASTAFRRRWEIAGWFGLLAATLLFGLLSPADWSEAPRRRVALIQQNVDPWRGGLSAYRDSLAALLRQSDHALKEDPDIVVWSETSFVPAIDWHTRYRSNPEAYDLVRELDRYLQRQTKPFVIGNDDGRLEPNREGRLERVDYNAVLLHDDGAYRSIYRKVHLVPFSEHFPYRGLLTWMYRMLVETETHFWKAGTEYTVFNAAGFRFSTPICFEDTFGYLSRAFVRNGAEVIVNMSNDLWSQSIHGAVQHLGMAVFRAVENRRTVVRSTNGGMTAVIDPNGHILNELPAFTEDYLVHDIPIYTERTTLYTRWGDWFAWAILGVGVASLACCTAIRLHRVRRSYKITPL